MKCLYSRGLKQFLLSAECNIRGTSCARRTSATERILLQRGNPLRSPAGWLGTQMHSGSLARVREMPPDDRVTGCECSDPIAGRAASPATLPTDVLAYAASPGKDG